MIEINGQKLTIGQILQVACENEQVALEPKAVEQAEAARAVVLSLSSSEQQIYGLNTGLGANKDNHIPPEDYCIFNERILHSHSVGLPPYADRATVRATMLVRLNSLMNGVAGVQTEILFLLRDMLNCQIHPRIPVRGSVGMADLGNLAYMGLAMIGEGAVEYKGDHLPAGKAFSLCGLKPIRLGPKDGLPLVSSNALAMAQAALLCADVDNVLKMADLIYAMGYEAQGYNPMFLDPRSCRKRPLKGQYDSLRYVRTCLKGSSLWACGNESLHGALSYKSSCAIHGAVRDAYDYTRNQLLRYINSSDDCPMVLAEEGTMISTDNFIVTGMSLALEMLGLSLSHLSHLSATRVLRLDNEQFSGLPRFLRPRKEVIAYSTIQKTVSALDTEVRHLANPASLDYLPTANESEDHGCNTPYVVQKTMRIVDLLYWLLGIEAMHAAQAADLAGRKPSGKGTRFAYEIIRRKISFLEEDDRDLGAEMQKAYQLVRDRVILPDLEEDLQC
ncbi:HAL/PAL/TAL family ammonia-lyase [Clostridium transplantifaecale]|uniref:HAL/PAL/TAL family ammonia-lyase n=1 Tax=Clostridium transplantifaecale TaxID=2479838 RepID=UPI000F641DC7|nr:aromatic amino acid ammonia-lyase [Clostridium transplantifaecale]